MTINQFWNIVERVHAASPADMDAKCRLLAGELRQLAPDEMQSFGDHFTDCFYQAYTWEIWDAAYLINDGCGDDTFTDFRSTLISLGRAPFEAALANADLLADFNIDPAWATYEGYQYVVGEVYEEKGCKGIVNRRTHPREAAGVSCPEWEMSRKFPKLAAKYGHKDADYSYLKEREEKRFRDEQQASQLVVLMLEAGIIPSCGLIPPLRIVARVLRTGQAPASTGRQYLWEPCELDEGIYWIALSNLEKVGPEVLKNRPELQGVALLLDVGAPEINDFDDWSLSLKNRGLA